MFKGSVLPIVVGNYNVNFTNKCAFAGRYKHVCMFKVKIIFQPQFTRKYQTHLLKQGSTWLTTLSVHMYTWIVQITFWFGVDDCTDNMLARMINNIFTHAFRTDNRSIIVNINTLAFTSFQIMLFIMLNYNIIISKQCTVYAVKELQVIHQYSITIQSTFHQCSLNVHSMSIEQPFSDPFPTPQQGFTKQYCQQLAPTTTNAYKSLFGDISVYESSILIHYNTRTHSNSHKTSEKLLWDPANVMWCCRHDIINDNWLQLI